MFLRTICKQIKLSPTAAKSIEDLKLDESIYKADFEVGTKFQAFSKELTRISLLGLGVYGFLIKLGADSPGHELTRILLPHKVLMVIVGGMGVVSFAVTAICALFHSYLDSKCMGYQLNISRHLQRMTSSEWDAPEKKISREYVAELRSDQGAALRLASLLIQIATFGLVAGAVSIATCSIFVLVIS